MSIKKNASSYVGVGRPISVNGVSLSNCDNPNFGKKLYGSSHAQWGQKVDLADAVSAHPMPVTKGGDGNQTTVRLSKNQGGAGLKG
jgi:hypothetical protein